MFYREWLPKFRRLGKTVIAVSHDDRFLAAAGRVIVASEGRVVDVIEALGESPHESLPYLELQIRARSREERASS